MSVTADVTHVLRSWVNAAAPLNMLFMSVTAESPMSRCSG